MKSLSKWIVGAVILLLGAVGFAYSGLYNVSALSEHSSLATWVLSTTSRKSIERRAQNISVPDLSDEKLVLAGANDYQSMCIACHGGPGTRPEAVGKGLNPPPTNLAEAARHMTAAELFWATKNGVRMTGMPAWGASHGDEEIWPVVAFLIALTDMKADEYQSLLKRASGMGHHASDTDHPTEGVDHHAKEDSTKTALVEHAHSDTNTSLIESKKMEHEHVEGHENEAGQDQADTEISPEAVQQPKAESHNEHKH